MSTWFTLRNFAHCGVAVGMMATGKVYKCRALSRWHWSTQRLCQHQTHSTAVLFFRLTDGLDCLTPLGSDRRGLTGAVGDSVVKFNVVNLTKPDSLFAMGMRPVMYSHQDAAGKGLGWRRCGHGIDYRRYGVLLAALAPIFSPGYCDRVLTYEYVYWRIWTPLHSSIPPSPPPLVPPFYPIPVTGTRGTSPTDRTPVSTR